MGCHLIFLAALVAFAAPSLAGDGKRWWEDTIIYEIYPQSFYDSDGDGLGDLKGIEHKIEYLESIKVGAVWLNPMYPSPGKDNGYDISDFRGINPSFGTMADFESLAETLKNSNIEIILDFVPNHTSDQHEWFQKSLKREKPYDDYYVWKDPKEWKDGRPVPPNNWESVFRTGEPGSAWFWKDERQQYYFHGFKNEQPDLDFRNPKVVQEMKDILKFWMDKGVRGFRVDAVPHLFEDAEMRDEHGGGHPYTQNLPETYKLIQELRAFTDAYGEKHDQDIFFTTEGYATPEQTIRYYGTSTNPGAHFPFNFLLLTGLDAETNAKSLDKTIVNYLTSLDKFQYPNWVSGNHDWPRIPSRMGASSAVDLINMLNLLLPGTATVYMGDEIGMDSYWSYDKSQCPGDVGWDYRTPGRTPFHWDNTVNSGFTRAKKPWIPINPEYYYTNVASQNSFTARRTLKSSYLSNFKKLAGLKSTSTFTRGSMKSYVVNDHVYAFTRQYSGRIYLVIMNLGKSFSEPFDLAEKIPEISEDGAIDVVVRSVNMDRETDNYDLLLNLFSGEWNMPPKSGLVAWFTSTCEDTPKRGGCKPEPFWMARKQPNSSSRRKYFSNNNNNFNF